MTVASSSLSCFVILFITYYFQFLEELYTCKNTKTDIFVYFFFICILYPIFVSVLKKTKRGHYVLAGWMYIGHLCVWCKCVTISQRTVIKKDSLLLKVRKAVSDRYVGLNVRISLVTECLASLVALWPTTATCIHSPGNISLTRSWLEGQQARLHSRVIPRLWGWKCRGPSPTISLMGTCQQRQHRTSFIFTLNVESECVC